MLWVSDKVQSELNGLVDLFSSKEFPKVLAHSMIKFPDVPSSAWSLSNKVIMAFHGSYDARGYRQWQEVGRYVKKGSHAFYILAPMFKTFEDLEADKESGQVKKVKQVRLVGFTGVPVFRLEDTEGKPLPEYKPQSSPCLIGVASRLGVSVAYRDLGGMAYGGFMPEKNRIFLASEDQTVFLHELAHACDNKINGTLKNGQDPIQELTAELASVALLGLYGLRTDKDLSIAYNYLKRYSNDQSPNAVSRACLKVLARVEKVVKEIVRLAEEAQEIQVITKEA